MDATSRRPGVQRNTLGASTALITALSLGACMPSAAPSPPFEITLTIVTVVVGRDASMAPNTVLCAYTITARAASGRAGQRATWLGGESVLEFVDGGSQTIIRSQADVIDFFKIDGLRTSEIASGRIV